MGLEFGIARGQRGVTERGVEGFGDGREKDKGRGAEAGEEDVAHKGVGLFCA